MPKALIRAPILLLAAFSLLAALWGGLLRLGWSLPPAASLAEAHGPLLAVGFLGTLITLERAVATSRPWCFAAAAATGLGGLTLALAGRTVVGLALLGIGSLGLLAAYGVVLRLQPSRATATMAAGAALLVAGNLAWAAGWPIGAVVPFWGGFLLLTIAGERLELSRLANPGPRAAQIFSVLALVFLAGTVAGAAAPALGGRGAGLAALAIAVWSARYDVARRTVRTGGLPRFSATCILTGYAWLACHALLSVLFPTETAGPLYDARWHALFLGFVFAMIFGHAPIILPAVLGRPLPFGNRFYAPLLVMQAGLLLRLAGDLAGWQDVRAWGGLLNVLAILAFLGLTASSLAWAAFTARAELPRAGSPDAPSSCPPTAS